MAYIRAHGEIIYFSLKVSKASIHNIRAFVLTVEDSI